MSNQESPSIQEIILGWADSYNNRIPIPEAQKRDAFEELFRTFTLHGYNKSDISTRVQNDIIAVCVPENYHNKSKLKIWKDITGKILTQAIISYYKTVEIVKLTEADRRKEQMRTLTVPHTEVQEEPVEKKLLDLEQFAHIEVPEINEQDLLNELGIDDE